MSGFYSIALAHLAAAKTPDALPVSKNDMILLSRVKRYGIDRAYSYALVASRAIRVNKHGSSFKLLQEP